MTGKVIAGRFGQPAPIDVSGFGKLVDYLNRVTKPGRGGEPVLLGGVENLVRGVAAAAMRPADQRAKCSDCADAATRDDGLCHRCRRHRQDLAP